MNLPIWLARNIKFLVCQFSVINISFLIGPTPEELAEMERIETEKRVGVFSLFFFLTLSSKWERMPLWKSRLRISRALHGPFFTG